MAAYSGSLTWTARTNPVDNQWRSVAWAPELSLFVAVSNFNNGIMTSPDGITWTSRTLPADNRYISVVWAPALSLFAAVGTTGTGNRVMTSPDGINWTTRTSAADNSWFSFTWSPELRLFAAVSSNGTDRVMTSPDGITWTSRSAAAANVWNSVAWSPELGIFAAVGQTGTGNRVMYSSDGITWTSGTSAVDNSWVYIMWSPELGKFVALAVGAGTGNRVMTSSVPAPTITAASSTPGATTASVAWTTDIYANTQLNYGLTADYTSTSTANFASSTAHTVSLTGLTECTTYHYRVRSTFVDQLTVGSDDTFTTSGCSSSDSSSDTTTSGNGAAVGSLGGGAGAAAFNTTLPGYIAPRPQIVYPDGRIVYLDTPTATAPRIPASTATPSFVQNRQVGDISEDIRALQVFLNTNGYTVSTTGAGSLGKETTTFGAKTKQALIKFQKDHNLPQTGYFGPLTRGGYGETRQVEAKAYTG